MNKLFFWIIPVLMLGMIQISKAQPSKGGKPPTFTLSGLPMEFESRFLAKPDIDQLLIEDETRDKQGYFYRAGISVPVHANLTNSGTWTELPNGDRIWRLKLIADGARATGVYYDQFWLPPGARLYLYNGDKTQILGAYTEDNNPESGYFATELIRGESVIIELFEPSRTKGRSAIRITEIAYVYRGVRSHFGGSQKDYGDSESCEVDVICSPEGDNWQDEKKGSARIFLKVGAMTGWCSGALVNNERLDCKPYFLTADHCGDGASTADLNQWVFYFNYEAPTCNYTGAEPSSNSITGCSLKSHGGNGGSSGSDFFLVEFNTAPTFNPYFNGWDRNNTAASSGVSIHHPAGDIQKISTFTTALVSDSWGSASGSHWRVVWASTTNGHGVTEGGSSGSPIFNSSGHIVGDLTGGSSYCSTPTAPDLYGKFSYSWDQNGTTPATRLKDWLDPDNVGLTTMDGFYCGSTPTLNANFSASATVIPVGGTVDFTDLSTGGPTSWSWTFNGGTPGTSTDQNPLSIQYNTAGLYTVSLTISDGTNSDTETKTNYINVGGSSPGDQLCDTLHYPLIGNFVLYSIRYMNGVYGYMSGNNGYSDSAKADYFLPSAPHIKLIGSYLKFGKATKYPSSTTKVVFAVWDNTGAGNSPGNIMATDTLPLGTIVTHAAGHQMTWISFEPPLVITSPFFLGVILPHDIGDTLALYTNKNMQSWPGTAWELWQNGLWYAYSDSSSWGYNLSHAIFPVICKAEYSIEEMDDPSQITVYPNPARSAVTVDLGLYLADKLEMTMYNVMGDFISAYDYSGTPTNTINIDLSGKNSGIYFLKIKTGNVTVTRKIMVIR